MDASSGHSPNSFLLRGALKGREGLGWGGRGAGEGADGPRWSNARSSLQGAVLRGARPRKNHFQLNKVIFKARGGRVRAVLAPLIPPPLPATNVRK